MSIDRRELLQALSALAASALAGPAHAQPASALTAAQFGALSTALTGVPAADADTVAKMMRAFATPERRASLVALAKLVAATPPGDFDSALAASKLDTVAKDLVAAWYSGLVTTAKGTQVVLYAQASMWTAMSYTKPMGVCGGVTGYWAEPPA